MSYDLEVWKENMPIGTREAATKIAKYWEEDKSVFLDHPDVQSFAREIVEVFPIETVASDDFIWQGFDATSAFVAMNFNSFRVAEVIPRLIEIASKYELVCFDGQRGIIHYPPSLEAMGYLRLVEIESGKIIDYPTETEIRELISSLSSEKSKFAYLERKTHLYLQTKIDDDGKNFTLEYRDGAEDKHFQILNVSREEVTQAFIEYSKNETYWMERFDWKKLEFSY